MEEVKDSAAVEMNAFGFAGYLCGEVFKLYWKWSDSGCFEPEVPFSVEGDIAGEADGTMWGGLSGGKRKI